MEWEGTGAKQQMQETQLGKKKMETRGTQTRQLGWSTDTAAVGIGRTVE